MDISDIRSHLSERLGDECVIKDAEMSGLCSFRCGGRAALLVKAEDMDALRYVLYLIAGADKMFCPYGNGGSACKSGCSCGTIPYTVIGNGTDILVRDGGYDGIVIKLGKGFSGAVRKGNRIIAGSAALLSSVARAAASEGLTGMEFASGIPGSIGGAVFMNAGAYGGEIKDIIRSVKAVSKDGIREYMMDAGELGLSYRHSIFTETGDIITEAEFELAPGDRSLITEKMKELSERRNAKQPLQYPSAGSFFKRPEGHFAGALIEEAGLKGLTVGGAAVSELHAGFIINRGGATATDIINLMKLIQNVVMDRSGVMLEPEVRIIGKDE